MRKRTRKSNALCSYPFAQKGFQMNSTTTAPRFPLGRLYATPGALEALSEAGQEASEFLYRHQHGDWGVRHVR